MRSSNSSPPDSSWYSEHVSAGLVSLNSVLPTSSRLQCLAWLISVSGDNGRLTRPVPKLKENVHVHSHDLYESSTSGIKFLPIRTNNILTSELIVHAAGKPLSIGRSTDRGHLCGSYWTAGKSSRIDGWSTSSNQTWFDRSNNIRAMDLSQQNWSRAVILLAWSHQTHHAACRLRWQNPNLLWEEAICSLIEAL